MSLLVPVPRAPSAYFHLEKGPLLLVSMLSDTTAYELHHIEGKGMPTGVYKRKSNGKAKAVKRRVPKRLPDLAGPVQNLGATNLGESTSQNWLKQRALELAIEAERSLPASLPTESRSKIVDRAAEYWNFLRGIL